MSASHRSKAQVWIIDSMMSGLFISLVFYTMIGAQEMYNSRSSLLDSQISFREAVVRASDTLVLTGGKPCNWETQTLSEGQLSSYGLAASPNIIDPVKAAKLGSDGNSNISEIKRALGLSKVNMSIQISSLSSGNVLYSIGQNPPMDRQAMVIERFALLNGNAVKVRIEAG